MQVPKEFEKLLHEIYKHYGGYDELVKIIILGLDKAYIAFPSLTRIVIHKRNKTYELGIDGILIKLSKYDITTYPKPSRKNKIIPCTEFHIYE